jgi:hypothetical protein
MLGPKTEDIQKVLLSHLQAGHSLDGEDLKATPSVRAKGEVVAPKARRRT